MAEDFVKSKTTTLTVEVDTTNNDSQLAGSSDTADGTKTITFSGIKKDVSGTEAEKVFSTILGDIGGLNYHTDTTKRTINYVVGEKSSKLSPELEASDDDIEVVAGGATEITITWQGDGKLHVDATQSVEGLTWSYGSVSADPIVIPGSDPITDPPTDTTTDPNPNPGGGSGGSTENSEGSPQTITFSNATSNGGTALYSIWVEETDTYDYEVVMVQVNALSAGGRG